LKLIKLNALIGSTYSPTAACPSQMGLKSNEL